MNQISRTCVILLALLMVMLVPATAQDDTFTLQILHSSDNESSFQDPNTLEPKILNYDVILNAARQIAPNGNSIYVTAGDHTLPGPFYQAASEIDMYGANGLADIAFYNAMGLTANGVGNHEFDGGINDFATMLATADYPFLSVNLDFSNVAVADGVPAITIGEDGSNVTDLAGQVARSAYVDVNGTKIGLIGRSPADFFNVIEDPENTLGGLDFYGGRNAEDNQPLVSAVDQVLEQVDLLTEQGINIIVLLDHAQDYTSDPLSAEALRGIDIIVAAGSTGFMAQAETDGPFNLLREGDAASADYPVVREDSEGNTLLVVNSDQLYTYVGNLIVTFDADGHVSEWDDRSGPIATTEAAIAEFNTLLDTELSPSADVVTIYDALQATELIQTQFEVIGTTSAELNGQRADVRSRETNLGRLAADSTLWWANEVMDLGVDIALKNGGGIRATVLGPNITNFSVATALAFNNEMVVIDLTGAELLAAMENAVSRVPSLDGRFPQVAGMVIEFDASQEGVSDQLTLDTATRIQRLVITKADGTEVVLVDGGEVVGDLSQTFRLVTNSFLLTGGDGYQAFAAAAEQQDVVNPGIGERQILSDYITQALGGNVDLAEPLSDARVIRLDAE